MTAPPGQPLDLAVGAVVIDVNDLDKQATFWSGLLGAHVMHREPDWVDVAELAPGGPVLSLQLVPEHKQHKNRLHLDLVVGDFALVSGKARDLGASAVSELHTPESPWQVFADPEGNEFCICTRG